MLECVEQHMGKLELCGEGVRPFRGLKYEIELVNKTKPEIQDRTDRKGSGVTGVKERAQEEHLDSDILRLHAGGLGCLLPSLSPARLCLSFRGRCD